MGKKGAVALISILLLSACTPQQLANYRRNTGNQTMQDMQAACKGFGFKFGTEAFANCMMHMSNKNDQVRATNSAAYVPQPQMNRSVTCQTFGNTTTCN